MKLLTKDHIKRLRNNHARDTGRPVVKLFGGGACTWLISQMAEDNDSLFGLCDIGHGSPELGYVSLKELEDLRFPPFGLGVERDIHFKPTKNLKRYADEARVAGRICA